MISCQMILLPSTRIISSLKTKYPVTGNNFTNKSTGFSIQISCEQLQISCLQCRHVDGDLRGLEGNVIDTTKYGIAHRKSG